MTTDAQIEANRLNAQKSTGPRTQAGKATASRNALTHGLTSTTRLLPDEDPEELATLTKGMLHDFNPLTTTETELVNQLIDFQWRLRRAGTFEAQVLSEDNPDYKILNNASLIAARIKRQFSATLKEFQQLHSANEARFHSDMAAAEAIVSADKILHRPSTLQQAGFDFTADAVERACRRGDAIRHACQIIEEHKSSRRPEPGHRTRVARAA
jgi:hypothetical protein